jgi:hypothetical protein
MEGNVLARAGMKKAGVSPFNATWAKDNAACFKPSEVYKTSGDHALMAEICRETPGVNTLTDARNILTAKRMLNAMSEHSEEFDKVFQNAGFTYEEARAVLIAVRLAEHANHPINNILVHPWWRKLLIKMGEIPEEPNGEGDAALRGSTYENRAKGMILNDPVRCQMLKDKQEAQDEEEFRKEAERQHKMEEQQIITKKMLEIGGYLDDTFDCGTDTLKVDVMKKFIKNNNLHKRQDYADKCQAAVPPRPVSKGLLQPACVQYLRMTIEWSDALDVDSVDRINWE